MATAAARRRSAGCAAAAGLASALACAPVRDLSVRAALDRQSDAYVRLVAALGERDPDSLDFYAGPPEWRNEARAAQQPLGTLRQTASALLADLHRDTSGDANQRARRAFLAGQVAAISARLDLLTGTRLSFDDESRRLFGAVASDRSPIDTEEVRRQLEALLPGKGALVRRYEAFDRGFIVGPDRVPAVMALAVEACRRRTLEHLPLPPQEHVDVAYVHGTPWSAFTRYRGGGRSVTDVNLDFALTLDRLLDLACHETYPGHHAINSWLDPRAQPMFSPMTFRTEGAASYAPELAFPGDRRLSQLRDLAGAAGLPDEDLPRYLAVSRLVNGLRWVQVDVARMYLDGRLEFVRAAAELQERGLMPESSSDGMLKFFNRFRTYSVTYTAGFDAVDKIVAGLDEPSRWRAFRRWIGG